MMSTDRVPSAGCLFMAVAFSWFAVPTELQEATSNRNGKANNEILRSEEHTSELQSRENLVCRHTPFLSSPTRRSSDLIFICIQLTIFVQILEFESIRFDDVYRPGSQCRLFIHGSCVFMVCRSD